MKDINVSCASQASTAICFSMKQIQAPSSSSSNTIQLGGRAVDRHNPIISDSRRATSIALAAPCASQTPIIPKPYNHRRKSNKKYSSNTLDHKNKPTKDNDQKKKKSIADNPIGAINSYSCKPIESILRKSWVQPSADLSTPPAGSSRYLLSDTPFLDEFSDYNPVSTDNKKTQPQKNTASSSSDQKSSSYDQIVVLRVSLHCKGCEGKVRKHVSRMAGVTSFNIDFAAKKVTVVGDVTPLAVLASISKVKNAQFWPASVSAVGSGKTEEPKK